MLSFDSKTKYSGPLSNTGLNHVDSGPDLVQYGAVNTVSLPCDFLKFFLFAPLLYCETTVYNAYSIQNIGWLALLAIPGNGRPLVGKFLQGVRNYPWIITCMGGGCPQLWCCSGVDCVCFSSSCLPWWRGSPASCGWESVSPRSLSVVFTHLRI